MPIKITIAALTFLVSGAIFPHLATADENLEKVRLQLRWLHQFQFAGYYAAKEKGYYREAGFDVEIIPGNPQRQPVSEVLSNRADFAEGNSEVVLSKLEGKPLIALAAIYQRSPSILLSRADSGIRTPKDLQGKTVMLVNGINSQDSDLLAMFHASGVALDTINIIPSSYDISDLSSRNVDAFNAYTTNEPFFLEEQNVPYQILRPSDYDIDFYSDILFTSAERIQKDPASAERFLAASLKGWAYALDHPEEIIKVIKDQYQSTKSLNHLRFEANAVRELILPELIPIGHINQQRIEKMAATLIQYNPSLSDDSLAMLKEFVFSPATGYDKFLYWIPYALVLLAVGVAMLLSRNHRLNKEIKQRI